MTRSDPALDPEPRHAVSAATDVAVSGVSDEDELLSTPTRVAAGGPLAVLLWESSLGDDRAFTQFYGETSPRVYGMVARVLQDPAQAEEVCQEVFLEVWRQSARFDAARGSVVGWMLATAHRRAIDRVRACESTRRRDDRHHRQVGRWEPDVTSDGVIATMEAQQVVTALTGLGDDQARVLELVYYGGYTHAEVAGLLDIPLGTAKTRIRTALRRLRDSLPADLAVA